MSQIPIDSPFPTPPLPRRGVHGRGNLDQYGRLLCDAQGRAIVQCPTDPRCCPPIIPATCLTFAQAQLLCPTAVLCNFGITQWVTQQQVGTQTVITTYSMPSTVQLNLTSVSGAGGPFPIWRNFLQGTTVNSTFGTITACFNVILRCVANGCWQIVSRLHTFSAAILNAHAGHPPCSLSTPTFGGPGGIRWRRAIQSGCPPLGTLIDPFLATDFTSNCTGNGTPASASFTSFPLTAAIS